MSELRIKLFIVAFGFMSMTCLIQPKSKKNNYVDEILFDEVYHAKKNLMYTKNFEKYKIKLYDTIKAIVKDI